MRIRADPPTQPWALKLCLILIYVLIVARIVLIQRALVESATAAASDDATKLWLLERSDAALVPGSFGAPLLFVILVPVLIVACRSMRRGGLIAARLVAGYLALRLVAIAVRGPYDLIALLLGTLTAAALALLLAPVSRAWFEEMSEAQNLRQMA